MTVAGRMAEYPGFVWLEAFSGGAGEFFARRCGVSCAILRGKYNTRRREVMKKVPKALLEHTKMVSEWSSAVKARDGMCVKCDRQDQLFAVRLDKKDGFQLANGVTLCTTCRTKAYARKVRLDRPKPQKRTLWSRIRELEAEVEALKRGSDGG
jgi:hypothetical protein